MSCWSLYDYCLAVVQNCRQATHICVPVFIHVAPSATAPPSPVKPSRITFNSHHRCLFVVGVVCASTVPALMVCSCSLPDLAVVEMLALLLSAFGDLTVLTGACGTAKAVLSTPHPPNIHTQTHRPPLPPALRAPTAGRVGCRSGRIGVAVHAVGRGFKYTGACGCVAGVAA